MAILISIAITVSVFPVSAFLSSTENKRTLHWVDTEIVIHPVIPEHSNNIALDEFIPILQEALNEWNEALTQCNTPLLVIGKNLDTSVMAVQDSRNVIIVRENNWCPQKNQGIEQCYDQTLAGITHLYPRFVPGSQFDAEITEADIQINAFHYQWNSHENSDGLLRLRALLVHELGHVLGLVHALPSMSGFYTSVMYPNPLEPDRSLVQTPGKTEILLLCELYD